MGNLVQFCEGQIGHAHLWVVQGWGSTRQPHSPAIAACQIFTQIVPAQPPVVMMAAAAKYPKVQGKSDEDPDAHVCKFDKIYWLVRVVQQHKESVLESTLSGKASRWLAKYPIDHFQDYDVVRVSFL